jgi:hypothetical protein
MIEESDEVVYRTRWGRTSIAASLAFALVAGIGLTMFKGALAASYVATSTSGGLTASGLNTEQVGAIVRAIPVRNSNGETYDEWVATFLIGKGYANTVCLTEKATLFGQTVTLMLTAGDDDPATNEIELDGLTLNVYDATTYLQAQGMTSINKNPVDINIPGAPPATGASPLEFGLEAQNAVLRGVTARVSDAELIHLPNVQNLKADFLVGDRDCPPVR